MSSRREEAAREARRQLDARRAYLAGLLNKTYFSRFTVEAARKTTINTKGRSALEYVFRVNVYSKGDTVMPKASLVFALDVENKTVLETVRRELVRCGLD